MGGYGTPAARALLKRALCDASALKTVCSGLQCAARGTVL
jgi:hypothetical protein